MCVCVADKAFSQKYCISKFNGCALFLMMLYFSFLLFLFIFFSFIFVIVAVPSSFSNYICIHSYALRMLVRQTRHIAPDGKKNNNNVKMISRWLFCVSRFYSFPFFFFQDSPQYCVL